MCPRPGSGAGDATRRWAGRDRLVVPPGADALGGLPAHGSRWASSGEASDSEQPTARRGSLSRGNIVSGTRCNASERKG